MTDTYKKALHAAREELVKLLGQKEEIDNRVAQLQQTVNGLAALCGEAVEISEPDSIQSQILRVYGDALETLTGKPGLTDAIRAALRAFNRPLTPVEVRDALKSLGYDLSIYSNVLASIHTILKRLVESGELEEVDKEGKKAYESKPSLAQAHIDKNYGWVLAREAAKKEETTPPPTTRSKGVVFKPEVNKNTLGIKPRNTTAMEMLKQRGKKE